MGIPDWISEAVFYQIFPDRFRRGGQAGLPQPADHFEDWEGPPTIRGFKGGSLWGVAEKLDYLVSLGFNAIYLNPIFASSANHRYHTSDYLRVDPLLGGDAALQNLLNEAHRRGVKVILDGVFNHSGRGFFAFNHLLENGPASPYSDWYYVKGYPLRAYSAKPNYAAWWDNPELPKLRIETPEVRNYLLAVAEHWIRFGADGWRLDVPEEISDMEFWREFRRRVKDANPQAYIVGEIWHEAADWVGEDGPFDGVMNYPLGRAILAYVGGKDFDYQLAASSGLGRFAPLDGRSWLERVAELLHIYQGPTAMAQLNLLGSHDTPRLFTMMRQSATKTALALELLFTLPGAPSVYYGDEIALAGGHDPDNRRAFPWDEAKWRKDVQSRLRRAASLRREHAALRLGEFSGRWGEGGRAAFRRVQDSEELLVIVNASPEEWKIELPCDSQDEFWRSLSSKASLSCASGSLRGELMQPFSLLIFSARR